MHSRTRHLAVLALSCLFLLSSRARADRPNILLILSDDHRYDFLGFHPGGPDFLETPALDGLAARGVHLGNAFVSTSLCSPSRATILTGLYMHHHRVVDNQRPIAEGTRMFPGLLQEAGYETAFIGKWHMGHDHDEPRPGFDRWESFRGQGTYFDPVLNIDGERRTFRGYTTDILAARAIRWLESREGDDPFFLMLSFKAVHYPFTPAPRHRGRYADAKIDYPETMARSEENYLTQSRWVRERRYSIHGIDHMETGAYDKDPVPDFDALYRSFAETVHGLDENVGRVLGALDRKGLTDSTVVLYLGDNGFALGEHGFYDKRDAFEESIRIPFIVAGPGVARPGSAIEELVQNLDVAPTVLELAGVEAGDRMKLDGRSLVPLLGGKKVPWREHILYEYHWEWNFPATPTNLAIRTSRYKYIYYHGIWDRDGFFDLETDPHERHNLITVPAYQERIEELRQQLFDEMERSGGLHLPIRRPRGERLGDRKLGHGGR